MSEHQDAARIPARHVLRRRVWGPVGFRQGAYTGAGAAIGLLLMLLLAGPLGFTVGLGVFAIFSMVGLIWGGIEFGGIAPERYLWHLVLDQWGSPRARIWRLDTPRPRAPHGTALAQAVRAHQAATRPRAAGAPTFRRRHLGTTDATLRPTLTERLLASPRAMAALGASASLVGYLLSTSGLDRQLVRQLLALSTFGGL